jgi:hypothetical protein
MAVLPLAALVDWYVAGLLSRETNLDLASITWAYHHREEGTSNDRVWPISKRASRPIRNPDKACYPKDMSNSLIDQSSWYHEIRPQSAKTRSTRAHKGSIWLALMWIVLVVLCTANIVGVARADGGVGGAQGINSSSPAARTESNGELPSKVATVPGLKALTDLSRKNDCDYACHLYLRLRSG